MRLLAAKLYFGLACSPFLLVCVSDWLAFHLQFHLHAFASSEGHSSMGTCMVHQVYQEKFEVLLVCGDVFLLPAEQVVDPVLPANCMYHTLHSQFSLRSSVVGEVLMCGDSCLNQHMVGTRRSW